MKKIGVLLILMGVLVILLLIAGCSMKEYNPCQLSSCDCKCYVGNTTPEAQQGLVCGNDCWEWKYVYGCEYVEGKCEVLQEGSGIGFKKTFK